MFTAFAAWLAKSALMQSPVGGFLKAIPRQVWIALAIGLAVLAAVIWHQHRAHAAIDAAYQRGVDDTEARYAAKAVEWVARIDEIASKRRSKNNEANRRIDDHAVSLLVRGPGKATCPYPAAPAARSGPNPPGGAGPAGLGRLPDQGRPVLAAVPFDDFVALQRFCALNRQEVIDRRAAEQDTLEAWKKINEGR